MSKQNSVNLVAVVGVGFAVALIFVVGSALIGKTVSAEPEHKVKYEYKVIFPINDLWKDLQEKAEKDLQEEKEKGLVDASHSTFVSHPGSKELAGRLTKLGSEGWEIVHVDKNFGWLFKRRVK